MKVKDLINELQKLNPEHDVYGLCEDVEIVGKDKFVEVFSIKDVSISSAKPSRNKSGKPEFIFFPNEGGIDLCFINFTIDF